MNNPATTASKSSAHTLLVDARAVKLADAPDYSGFVDELLREEAGDRHRQTWAEPSPVEELDRRLLEDGHPVAFCTGDELAELANVPDFDPDEDAAAEVMDIRIGQLRRFLRDLPPLQNKVVRLYWGIGCDRAHSQVEVAERVGLSQTTVSRALAAGMAALCERFEVPADLVA